MSKEAKLGMFVLAVFGVFLFFTVNMGKGIFSTSKRIYPIYFTNIGTLEEGAPVKQAGLDVGEVKSISSDIIMAPTPTFYVVVDVSLTDKAHISYDSRASIQTLGMMGEKYIEISFGKLEAAPEGTHLDGQGPQQLDRVVEDVLSLIEDVRYTIKSVNVIIGDSAFQADITKLIANLQSFSKNIDQLLGGQQDQLNKIVSNVEAASANLRSMIATAELFITDARGMINENRPSLKKTLDNTAGFSQTLKEEISPSLKKMSTQLTLLSEQLNKSTKSADQLIIKLDSILDENRPDLRNTMSNIQELSLNAKKASEKVDSLIQHIQQGDGLAHDLIYNATFSQAAQRTIRQASDMLGGASSFGDRFELRMDTRYFSDQPRFDSEDNNVRVDFGVRYAMTDALALYLGGNSLGTANEFEAQLAYRTGPITFHGGMAESEVALGADWQIFKRWMLGVQGIGLTHDDKERLDVYSEFLLWKHFSLIGGVQDITDEQYPNVGIRWRY